MTNESEVNRIGKDLTTIGTYTGTLRSECSIMNPSIIIEGVSDSNIATANYLYIGDFGRYYFINDVRSIRKGLWEITAHVDVLETYSSQILSNTAIIKRQETRYNLYLDDGNFKVYSNPQVFLKKFPNSFPNSGSYVLLVVGS